MLRVFNSSSYTQVRGFCAKKLNKLDFSEEVKYALESNKPVVALESTIITHGMPYPQNVECALGCEEQIRNSGAVPATIAILKGRLTIGLTRPQIEQIGDVKNVPSIKTSRRDFPYVIGNGLNGGTTVSGTLIAAHLSGIPIFATGGIGGVHRMGETTMDISADLLELGKTPVAVVSSGVKSILDIPRTLEYLETQGVFVSTYGPTNDFPAFYTRKSGCKAPYKVSTPLEAAKIIKSVQEFGLNSGMLFGVPVPEEYALDSEVIAEAIEDALRLADANGVRGKEVTPFLLARLSEVTQGKSLQTNIALVQNNAKVAGQIAAALKGIKDNEERVGKQLQSQEAMKPRVVVIGGSVLDRCVTVTDEEIKVGK